MPSTTPPPIYLRPLSYWVKVSAFPLQMTLLAVVAVTVVVRVLPLELQKKIINQAIGTAKIDLLILYCGYYVAAVVAAQALKFAINALQTAIGQRALTNLRQELYSHILTLPMDFFRRTSPGMIVSSLITEVSNVGEFIGSAVAVPVSNVLTLLAFAGYLYYLNPLLAGLSMVLYPLALLTVPIMQRRANKANKERVDISRTMSAMVSETTSGIHEIHGNASFTLENRRFAEISERLRKVRVRWTLYRFAIKNSNNFFQSLGPFILFLVGGYLTIQGHFDLGALVAFLSANEKLYDPWRELMDFYQSRQDAKISYERIMEYFAGEPEFPLESAEPRKPLRFDGSIAIRDVSMATPNGIKLLSGVSLDIAAGAQVALVGFSGSGKSTLALCLCQINKTSQGKITFAGHEVSETPKSDIADNLGIVPQQPYIFNGSIRDNLVYSLAARLEAHGDPVDENLPSSDHIIEVVQQVGLFPDILRFGLTAHLKRGRKEHFSAKIVRVRQAYHERPPDKVRHLVEFFDESTFLEYGSVAENILFGTAEKPEFETENLPGNQAFAHFLDSVELTGPLQALGLAAAAETVDILRHLPEPDAAFFDQTPLTLDDFESIMAWPKSDFLPGASRTADKQATLLRLGLRFCPARHKIAHLSLTTRQAIMHARALFREQTAKTAPEAVTFFERDAFCYSLSILENIVFGKLTSDAPGDIDTLNQSIVSHLIQEDMLERVLELGMDFQVGASGDRLSGGQRQKVALARAFLKEPPILILDEATAALDNASQARIQNLLATKWRGRSTVVAVAHRLDTIKDYDLIACMRAGRVIEAGTYAELMAKKGMLYELVGSAK